MTSRSRRKRPTTAWPTTPPRTGISLAVLAAWAAAAPAQGPFPPPVPASASRPTSVPAVPNVRPQLMPADAPPAVPQQVILLQKSPGSDAPAPGGALPAVPTPQLPDDPVAQKTQGGTVSPKLVPPTTKAEDKVAEKGPPVTLPVPAGITRDAAFRLQSTQEMLNRVTEELIQEERARRLRLNEPNWQPRPDFFRAPPEARLPGADQPYQPKTLTYEPYQLAIEPGYVVHRRLHFEEPNSERHLWDLGFAQPIVSSLYFYKDVLLWPASLTSNIHERYDTSAGKCPPGSPFPYSLYPPQYDLLGLGTEAAIITGAAFLFP